MKKILFASVCVLACCLSLQAQPGGGRGFGMMGRQPVRRRGHDVLLAEQQTQHLPDIGIVVHHKDTGNLRHEINSFSVLSALLYHIFPGRKPFFAEIKKS